MKAIKCLSETIECTLDKAEDSIKEAIKYKDEAPVAAQTFYNHSVALMNSIKGLHDGVVAMIEAYRKEKGEPPAPMMAIYNYMHERQMTQAAGIKTLQDMYAK